MKYYNLFLLIFLASVSPKVYSQITIDADTTWGCGSLTVTFTQTNTLPSVTSVLWKFGDGGTSTANIPTHAYSTPGIYDVTVILNGTDSLKRTNYITVHRKPQAEISYRDTITPLHIILQVNVTNESEIINLPLTFSWDVDGNAAGNTRTIEYTFDTVGIYNSYVIVSDTKGCRDTATMEIPLIDRLQVPNVFSPNGDNINDLFKVSLEEKYFLQFQLFTRTGLLVYKTKAKTIEWDGKMPSGEDVPSGIYFYSIDAEGSSPHIAEKGFLYIFR